MYSKFDIGKPLDVWQGQDAEPDLSKMDTEMLRSLHRACRANARICTQTYMATGDTDALAGQKRYSALVRLYDAEITRREQAETEENNSPVCA